MTFFYGASRLVALFRREVQGKNLLGATFYSPSTGQTVQGSPTVVVQVRVPVREGVPGLYKCPLLGLGLATPTSLELAKTNTPQYLLAHEGPLCGVLALASVMGLVLLAFLVYHLHLSLQNTTTNETFKWQIARARVQRQREKAQRAQEITGGLDWWSRCIGSGDASCESAADICDSMRMFLSITHTRMQVVSWPMRTRARCRRSRLTPIGCRRGGSTGAKCCAPGASGKGPGGGRSGGRRTTRRTSDFDWVTQNGVKCNFSVCAGIRLVKMG